MKVDKYIKKNLWKILSESYKWRHRELLTSKDAIQKELTRMSIFRANILSTLFGLVFTFFFPKAFNSDVSGFLVTSLSIFIGLFISVLIMVFDKFVSRQQSFEESRKEKLSDRIKLNHVRTRNFTRRFSFVLLETLIIAFVTIIFLVPIIVFNERLSIDVLDYKFVKIEDVQWDDIKTLFISVISITIKTAIIVLMYRFTMFMFFLLAALGEYIKGVLYGKVDV